MDHQRTAHGRGATARRRTVLRTPEVVIDRRVHRNAHLLIWQILGSSTITVDSTDTLVPPGYACWIPAGSPHALVVHKDSTMLPVFFDPTPVNAHLRPRSLHRVSAELSEVLTALVQQQYSYASGADLQGQAAALLVSASTADDDGWLPWPRSSPVLSVASTLSQAPGDQRSPAELAASVNVSERTLQRRFLKETGLTLQQWRARNRLVRALEMLRGGTLVSVAAAQVGYRDVSAFRRAFKAHFGVPPSRHSSVEDAGGPSTR